MWQVRCFILRIARYTNTALSADNSPTDIIILSKISECHGSQGHHILNGFQKQLTCGIIQSWGGAFFTGLCATFLEGFCKTFHGNLCLAARSVCLLQWCLNSFSKSSHCVFSSYLEPRSCLVDLQSSHQSLPCCRNLHMLCFKINGRHFERLFGDYFLTNKLYYLFVVYLYFQSTLRTSLITCSQTSLEVSEEVAISLDYRR